RLPASTARRSRSAQPGRAGRLRGVVRRALGYDPVPEAHRGGRLLDIQVEEADSYTVCRPVGELDAYNVSQFREALGKLTSRPKLLIDMSAVPFVDSAGLGALIGGIRRAREAGGEVAVCC